MRALTLFLNIVSVLSPRLLRSRVLWKPPRFTSLVAPGQTKGYSYGRRGVSVWPFLLPLQTGTACGAVTLSHVMVFWDFYYAVAWREKRIYVSLLGKSEI